MRVHRDAIVLFLLESANYTPESFMQMLESVILNRSDYQLFRLEKLIKEMATKLDNSNIQSLEDLQNEGILNSTNMYVPDNFLLEKNEASFLYNKYDIAPYAMGTIVLSLPYAEIEKYMIHQTNN